MRIVDTLRGKMFSRSCSSQRVTPINSVSGDDLVFASGGILDVIGDRDAQPLLIVIAGLPIAHRGGLPENVPITVLEQEELTSGSLQLIDELSLTDARSTNAARQSIGRRLEPFMAGSADGDVVVLRALMLRCVVPIEGDEAGWVPTGDTGSPFVIHPQSFSHIIDTTYLIIVACMIGVRCDLPEAKRAGCDAAERAE